MFNAGHYNKIIKIQVKKEPVLDEDGYPLPPQNQTSKYETIYTLHAIVKTTSYRELIQDSSLQNEVTTRFIVRYSPKLNLDNKSMTIDYNGRVFDIKSIINDDEKNLTLTLIGVEQNL